MTEERAPLGDRMKAFENPWTDIRILPNYYAIIRLDGKAFHTFTRGFKKPFDHNIIYAMQMTMGDLVENIPGVKLAYTQSDEISLVLTAFDKPNSELWFAGKIHKIGSVAAAIATHSFNSHLKDALGLDFNPPEVKNPALFDARVFGIRDREDVIDYFVWRYRDAYRNGVSAAAQAHFPHKELNGVKTLEKIIKMQEEHGTDYFQRYDASERLGTAALKVPSTELVTYTRKDTGEVLSEEVERTKVVWESLPDTGINEYLDSKIPAKPNPNLW